MKKYLVSTAILCAMTTPAYAAKIKQILVVDNTKTSDETVIMLADIEVGDTWDPETTHDRVERDLVSSGLFKDVDVFTQPIVGGLQVTISAKDKHSWIIAPTFYNQPTNRGAGIGFGENNLFGENKKLLLYGQAATGDSFFLGAYVDPSINASRWHWQWDVFLRRERVFEYAPPDAWLDKSQPKELRKSKLNYLNSGVKFGVNLFRKISLSARLRGAYVFFDNVTLGADADGDVELVSPNNGGELLAPGEDGWDVSSELVLKFKGIANWYGIMSGDKYKVAIERSLSALGSDYDYWNTEVRWTRARKFFSRHNFVTKLELNYGKNIPYQKEFTSGGTDLRGFTNRQFRGNVRTALTAEYSIPIVTVKGLAFRAQTFWDSTYTTFVNSGAAESTGTSGRSRRNYLQGHEARGLSPFKNTVGVGTRVYIRSIVLPLLGLDVGYGLERRAKEIYFSIGLTGF